MSACANQVQLGEVFFKQYKCVLLPVAACIPRLPSSCNYTQAIHFVKSVQKDESRLPKVMFLL